MTRGYAELGFEFLLKLGAGQPGCPGKVLKSKVPARVCQYLITSFPDIRRHGKWFPDGIDDQHLQEQVETGSRKMGVSSVDSKVKHLPDKGDSPAELCADQVMGRCEQLFF